MLHHIFDAPKDWRTGTWVIEAEGTTAPSTGGCIWGLCERFPHLDRLWICCGVRHPSVSCVITVETNPPLEGFDRRCSGVFLRGDEGAVYLGHSGRVGGGRSMTVGCSKR